MMTRRLSSGWFYCTGIVGLVKSPNGCRDGGGGDRLDDYDDVKAATTHAMQQLTGICSIRHLLSVFDKRMTMIACCHFGSLYFSELHVQHVHVQCSLTFFFSLADVLAAESLTTSHLVAVHLYVKRMADFARINAVYKTYFGINPPVR